MRGSRRASAKGDGEDYQRGEVLGEGRVSTVYLCLNKHVRTRHDASTSHMESVDEW